MLDLITIATRNQNPKVIAGDFNAWAIEWGSKRTDKRGQALLEAYTEWDLTLLNDAKMPTFVKGKASSYIDLTFASNSIAKHETRWQVTDIYTHSDHCAITWHIPCCKEKRRSQQAGKPRGWKTETFDRDTFRIALEGDEYRKPQSTKAEEIVENIMKRVTEACNATMARCGNAINKRDPVYWWNEEIKEIRVQCLKARRLAQRAIRKESYPDLHMKYKELRSKLNRAIKKSKRATWVELLEDVDNDPWGRPYIIVMKKLKGSTQQPRNTEQLRHIVRTLFPQQEVSNYEITGLLEEIPPIMMEELVAACKTVRNKKAPGMDRIPNVALKEALAENPQMFLDAYNRCLDEGTFPEVWKRQRLVLIPKGNKDPEQPSSYRPLCMLDTAGKILERIIYNRIEAAIGHVLNSKQFGFRRARSTLDAIQRVVNIAKNATNGKRWKGGKKKYCLLVALDIKNAFNSARWDSICAAIDRLEVPQYLRRIIRNYLHNRTLHYDTEDGPETYKVTGGVPQGSVLGPLLWNIMYDGLLNLILPDGAELTAFADDAMVTITAKHTEEIRRIFEETYRRIQLWMESTGLKLAEHKTEALLVTSRKMVENLRLAVGSSYITTQPSIKYLGVFLDFRLNFNQHVEEAAMKTSKVTAALARLMPNVGGPRQKKRNLLMSVSTSVLLYGAPIWADALKNRMNRKKMESVYRVSLIRIISAFRTVSLDTACVIAGAIPVHLIADERKRLFTRRNDAYVMRNEARNSARSLTMCAWQQEWDQSTKGRWTHKLIGQVEKWLNRKHGEVNFYLTQMLTGHGCYRAYLHRFGHDDSPDCPHGCGVPEDAEHVFFACPAHSMERDDLEKTIGPITVENMVDNMLQSEEAWNKVSEYAAVVLKKLRRAEQERRRANLMDSRS